MIPCHYYYMHEFIFYFKMFDIHLFLFYVDECLPAGMFVCHVHAVPLEARRGLATPGLGVIDTCISVGAGNQTLGPLERQEVLLIA